MNTQPTIFIVDDDPAARESVAALVASHGMPVEKFGRAEEFLAAYDPARRGCLIVDVRMTGMSGLELIEKLSARGATLPVIVITGFADVPMAVRAMSSGAFTFLEKPCTDKELWPNIVGALEAEKRLNEERQHKAEIVARRASLTGPEEQVLEGLLAGKANKTIAAELGLGLRTVELRRATIMKKMEANSLAELVRLILVAEGKSNLPPRSNNGRGGPDAEPEALPPGVGYGAETV